MLVIAFKVQRYGKPRVEQNKSIYFCSAGAYSGLSLHIQHRQVVIMLTLADKFGTEAILFGIV